MSERRYTRLGLRILDEQLVDSTGRRVGRVEDIEFEGRPGETCYVDSVLCGATSWKRRLPRALGDFFPDDPARLRRVPWERIENVRHEIELRVPEDELHRAGDEDEWDVWLSQLLARPVIDAKGNNHGKVRDVIVTRLESEQDDERPEGELNRWEIFGLLVGFRALLLRAGFVPRLSNEILAGNMPLGLIGWDRGRSVEPDAIGID